MTTSYSATPTPASRFDTVLVANRGEIAVRVIRSARSAGYRTVAVFSDADVDAPHVHAADVAVRLGPAPSAQSYLDVDAVLAAAAATGAGAIHPGYGFLSENAGFARACADAGIVFVGPSPEAIEVMGDKAVAKRRMQAAGVPCLPGYQGAAQDDNTLIAEAARIGAPLLVKAAAGGGGKGMRLVTDLADLTAALATARREAKASFGDDSMLLERAVTDPRHVEIQVLADTHGTVLALGERDCSVQRRHQKVVEEAPSPAVDDALRTRMQDAAVAVARDVEYVGAGTVEFLLAADGSFAFLEMNTRLQVEHPVTELITGLDLVELQLQIAQGQPLGLTQDDVTLTGHAIEVRLYAEDPDAGYLPQTGTAHQWQAPAGVRVDSGIATGSEVSAHYDPMLAKVIAHGANREEARRRLADALDRTVLLGVRSNRTFLARVLRDARFAAGEATTSFLDGWVAAEHDDAADAAVAAAWLHLTRERRAEDRAPGLSGWSSGGRQRVSQRLRGAGPDDLDVMLTRTRDGLTVVIGERSWTVTGTPDALIIDGQRVDLDAHGLGPDRVLLRRAHRDLDVTDVRLALADTDDAAGAGVLTAPMHGAVTAVEVVVGDRVARGASIIAIEAMKMEHVLVADVDGVVAELASLGAQVATGAVLARIEPDGDADGG
jgi:geranyl-CoA carboxylase alpha subunit